jgi:hypothetical protein
MANKKIKSSRQIDGKIISANNIIRKFLTFEGAKMFGEINEHLKENNIIYSKKGLHLRLNSLIEDNEIVKTENKTSSYPVYVISTTYPEAKSGQMLQHAMNDTLMEDVFPNLKKTQWFPLMTTLIGVYSMYVDILSWKLTDPDDSFEKMFEKRSLFIRGALPLISPWSSVEYDGDVSKILIAPEKYTKEEFKKSILQFERHLKKTFPNELKICQMANNKKTAMIKRRYESESRF